MLVDKIYLHPEEAASRLHLSHASFMFALFCWLNDNRLRESLYVNGQWLLYWPEIKQLMEQTVCQADTKAAESIKNKDRPEQMVASDADGVKVKEPLPDEAVCLEVAKAGAPAKKKGRPRKKAASNTAGVEVKNLLSDEAVSLDVEAVAVPVKKRGQPRKRGVSDTSEAEVKEPQQDNRVCAETNQASSPDKERVDTKAADRSVDTSALPPILQYMYDLQEAYQ